MRCWSAIKEHEYLHLASLHSRTLKHHACYQACEIGCGEVCIDHLCPDNDSNRSGMQQQQLLPQVSQHIHYICYSNIDTARQQTPLTPACHQFRIAIRPCPFIVTPGQPDSCFIPKQCSDERIKYCKPFTTLLIPNTILASCKASFTNKCVNCVL